MSKINAAESIRGLACMAVVLSHLSLVFYPYLHRDKQSGLPNYEFTYYLHHSPFNFIYSGNAAVYVFFVLSGFVLSYAIQNKGQNTERKILSMSIKRYPRLAIPALLSVLMYWACFHLNLNVHNASIWAARFGTQTGSIFDAFYDGTIRSFIFGKSNYNWVLWTMQVELFGSFLIFLLNYLILKNRILTLIVAIISTILSVLISLKFALGITCFVLGMFIYFYGKKISLKLSLPILILGLYLAGTHNTSYSYQWIYGLFGNNSYAWMTVVSAPLIVYPILMSEEISKALDKKWLVFLGKLSFSIYLLHLLIIYLIGLPLYNLMLPVFGFLISSIIASILTITVSILVAIPYSHYVDDFSIKVGKAIESKVT